MPFEGCMWARDIEWVCCGVRCADCRKPRVSECAKDGFQGMEGNADLRSSLLKNVLAQVSQVRTVDEVTRAWPF